MSPENNSEKGDFLKFGWSYLHKIKRAISDLVHLGDQIDSEKLTIDILRIVDENTALHKHLSASYLKSKNSSSDNAALSKKVLELKNSTPLQDGSVLTVSDLGEYSKEADIETTEEKADFNDVKHFIEKIILDGGSFTMTTCYEGKKYSVKFTLKKPEFDHPRKIKKVSKIRSHIKKL